MEMDTRIMDKDSNIDHSETAYALAVHDGPGDVFARDVLLH